MYSTAVSHLSFVGSAVLTELGDWLRSCAILAGLFIGLGALVLRATRARNLHWSWGPLVIVVVTVVHAPLGSLAPPLVLAVGAATLRARRRHLERIELGADLGRAAASSLSPATVLRHTLASVERRRRERGGGGGWFRRGELVLGVERGGALVSIPFGAASGGSHTLLVGATGSGKTVTATWMTLRAIEHGMGAVVIDPKGDRAMRSAVAQGAERCGCRFLEWSPSGPSVYNPLARGSETEIADKLLGAERFTEPHYLRQSQRFIGHVVRSLRGVGEPVSLRAVVEALDASSLELLSRELPRQEAEATQRYLDSLSQRQLADLSGVRDRLAILVESDIGRWLDPEHAQGGPVIDLLTAIRSHSVVYFSLAADSRPLLTQMLGAAIVQDLTTAVASLQHEPTSAVVAIDEFSTLAAEHVVRLFARARSAGISLVLGTQELSDLRVAGRELLLEQVLGNLRVLIAHRQVVPSSAELVASLAGTRGAWRTTRSGSRVTRARSRELALEPSEVMNLATGEAATIVLGDGPGARITQVFSPAKAVARTHRRLAIGTGEGR